MVVFWAEEIRSAALVADGLEGAAEVKGGCVEVTLAPLLSPW